MYAEDCPSIGRRNWSGDEDGGLATMTTDPRTDPHAAGERVPPDPVPSAEVAGDPAADAPAKRVDAPRAKPSSPAALLRQLGLKPRRGLSQSFLTDVGVTKRIAAAADLSKKDAVLEVGPGLGILTQELARVAGRVVAFELDRDLAAVLPRMVPQNVQIVQGDALTLNPADYVPGRYKLVANLPYQITSPFLFRYLSLSPAPEVLVLMIQREVAERIAAPPGQLSYLAVAVQSAARPRIVRLVPPGAFHPRPKVESAVIKLEPLAEPLVPPADRQAFLEVVRAGFGQPRKQLLNSMHQGLKQANLSGHDWSRTDVQMILARAGIDLERRPQALTLTEWRAVFQAHRSLEPDVQGRLGESGV
ncbi:MAG: 16S rRNA (adenine(1518)-N(6)/adenine(1519)-N(6))-dimethyltransferase RsmA [Chloroflexota bacterium]